MAVTQNTLIGRSRGSVGGVTFTTWKGLNVIKSKAVSVANPNTPAQQVQRARLAAIVAMYRIVAFALKIGYRSQAIEQSAYNAFSADNIIDGTQEITGNSARINPATVQVSKGTIGQTAIASFSGATGSSVLTWATDLPIGGSADDEAYAVIWNEEAQEWSFNTTPVNRSAGTLTVPSVATIDGDTEMYARLFFASVSDNTVSDSASADQNT